MLHELLVEAINNNSRSLQLVLYVLHNLGPCLVRSGIVPFLYHNILESVECDSVSELGKRVRFNRFGFLFFLGFGLLRHLQELLALALPHLIVVFDYDSLSNVIVQFLKPNQLGNGCLKVLVNPNNFLLFDIHDVVDRCNLEQGGDRVIDRFTLLIELIAVHSESINEYVKQIKVRFIAVLDFSLDQIKLSLSLFLWRILPSEELTENMDLLRIGVVLFDVAKELDELFEPLFDNVFH